MREPYELELLLRVFEDVGARHLVTSEGEITSGSVMVARIRASVSAGEIRKMRERRKRRQEDIALDGRWGGGFRQFGYDIVHRSGDPAASKTGHVLVINDAEAKLLRDAADRIIREEPAEAIAHEWDVKRIVTVTGKRWRDKSLRRILTAASITGLREHHGEIVGDAAWSAILDRVTWEAVRAASAARPEAKVGRPPREYLLPGGLTVCGLCGAPLRARPRADKVRSFSVWPRRAWTAHGRVAACGAWPSRWRRSSSTRCWRRSTAARWTRCCARTSRRRRRPPHRPAGRARRGGGEAGGGGGEVSGGGRQPGGVPAGAGPARGQGRVKVVVQASELRRCRQGRAAARSQHGRAVRRIDRPGHSDLAGRPVLTLQAGRHWEGSGASPGPVSTISAGQTGPFRL